MSPLFGGAFKETEALEECSDLVKFFHCHGYHRKEFVKRPSP